MVPKVVAASRVGPPTFSIFLLLSQLSQRPRAETLATQAIVLLMVVLRGNLLQAIEGTTQIWAVTCHQYGISVISIDFPQLFLRNLFEEKPVTTSQNVSYIFSG